MNVKQFSVEMWLQIQAVLGIFMGFQAHFKNTSKSCSSANQQSVNYTLPTSVIIHGCDVHVCSSVTPEPYIIGSEGLMSVEPKKTFNKVNKSIS